MVGLFKYKDVGLSALHNEALKTNAEKYYKRKKAGIESARKFCMYLHQNLKSKTNCSNFCCH